MVDSYYIREWASQVALWVNAGGLIDRVQSLGWEDLLEEGMATHSSILAWRILWTEESGRLQSVGLQKGQTQFSD